MKCRSLSGIVAMLACLGFALLAVPPGARADAQVENSYHAQLGNASGLGMLEKWCALPNFSFDQQGGVIGWNAAGCGACHIGAAWNDTRSAPDCTFCHESTNPGHRDIPGVDECMTCHSKDTAKRGDIFTPSEDVHIAAGFLCQTCHERMVSAGSDHQFRKGTIIDTTEQTLKGTLSCTAFCHDPKPHQSKKGQATVLNRHAEKVACETCHTGLRPASALARRQWNVFNEAGKPVTTMRAAGWKPVHKWYDDTGPGPAGGFDLPILGFTERRDLPGAKIHPFNAVSVDWFLRTPEAEYADVIVTPRVKAMDADHDGTVTQDEMRADPEFPGATLVTADMNFSISHSVVPVELAFDCKDCHGRNGWVLDWAQLGYAGDPRKNQGKAKGKPSQ